MVMGRDQLDKVRDEKLDMGYDPDDFGNNYWLQQGDHVSHIPRVKRRSPNMVNYFKDLLKKIDAVKETSVLDISAGAGNFVHELIDNSIIASGCEFTESGRKVALREFGIELKAGDLRIRLPYEDNEFDFSCCIGVLSMIPEDRQLNAISEILRVTKFGTLILTCTIVENGNLNHNPHHLTGRTIKSYHELMVKAGGHNVTDFHSPKQIPQYGIGVGTEFCGLFTKDMSWVN